MTSRVSRPASFSSGNARRQTTSAPGLKTQHKTWHVGQQVSHLKFGEGIVLNYEGQGEQARIQVKFVSCGVKWLAIAYAKLEVAK